MNKPIFKWLLIFKDGAHLNAEGTGIEEACQNVRRVRTDLAISRAGFLRALPLERTDNVVPMSQEVKDKLKECTLMRKFLRAPKFPGPKKKKRRSP